MSLGEMTVPHMQNDDFVTHLKAILSNKVFVLTMSAGIAESFCMNGCKRSA